MEISKFILCPDRANNELYILHNGYPSCLILVKQETPVRFVIQYLYEDVESEEELLLMPFVKEAKEFFAQSVRDGYGKN